MAVASGHQNRYLLHRHTLTRCSGFFEASTSNEWSRAQALPELLPAAGAANANANALAAGNELARIGEDGNSNTNGGGGSRNGSEAAGARPSMLSPPRKRWRYELDRGSGDGDIPMLVQKEETNPAASSLPSASLFGGGGGAGAADVTTGSSRGHHRTSSSTHSNHHFFRSVVNLSSSSHYPGSSSSSSNHHQADLPPPSQADQDPPPRLRQPLPHHVQLPAGAGPRQHRRRLRAVQVAADARRPVRRAGRGRPARRPPPAAVPVAAVEADRQVPHLVPAAGLPGALQGHLPRGPHPRGRPVARRRAQPARQPARRRARPHRGQGRRARGVGGPRRGAASSACTSSRAPATASPRPRPTSTGWPSPSSASAGRQHHAAAAALRARPHRSWPGCRRFFFYSRPALLRCPRPTSGLLLQLRRLSCAATVRFDHNQNHHYPTSLQHHHGGPPAPPSPPLSSLGRTYRALGGCAPGPGYLGHDECKRFLKLAPELYSRDNLRRFEKRIDELKAMAREVVRPLMGSALELDMAGAKAGAADGIGYLTCTRVGERDLPWADD